MEHSVRPKWSAGYELKDCVGEHKNQDNMYDENVRKLKFKFDVEELKKALKEVLEHSDINKVDQLCMTYSSQYPRHPDGDEYQGSGSLFYEYYATTEGVKNRRKNYQPERTFTEFVPAYKHTYFYHVWKELSKEYEDVEAPRNPETIIANDIMRKASKHWGGTEGFESLRKMASSGSKRI